MPMLASGLDPAQSAALWAPVWSLEAQVRVGVAGRPTGAGEGPLPTIPGQQFFRWRGGPPISHGRLLSNQARSVCLWPEPNDSQFGGF